MPTLNVTPGFENIPCFLFFWIVQKYCTDLWSTEGTVTLLQAHCTRALVPGHVSMKGNTATIALLLVKWAGFPPPKNRGQGVWSTTRADGPDCSTLTQAKLDVMGNYYSKKPSAGAVDHSLQARSKLHRMHTEAAELSQLNCVDLNSFLSGRDTVNNPGPRGLD